MVQVAPKELAVGWTSALSSRRSCRDCFYRQPCGHTPQGSGHPCLCTRVAAACNCFLSAACPKAGAGQIGYPEKVECLHKGYGRILAVAAVVNMSLGAVSAGRNYGSFGVKVSEVGLLLDWTHLDHWCNQGWNGQSCKLEPSTIRR